MNLLLLWKKVLAFTGRALEVPSKHGQLVNPKHPGGNPGSNRKSVSHRCHPILVAFAWELTKETNNFSLDCLQGGA